MSTNTSSRSNGDTRPCSNCSGVQEWQDDAWVCGECGTRSFPV